MEMLNDIPSNPDGSFTLHRYIASINYPNENHYVQVWTYSHKKACQAIAEYVADNSHENRQMPDRVLQTADRITARLQEGHTITIDNTTVLVHYDPNTGLLHHYESYPKASAFPFSQNFAVSSGNRTT